jgi:septum site-determining protein MinC
MVLRLKEAGAAEFEGALRTQIGRSPQFFANAPVVLDLTECGGFAEAADFAELKRLLRGIELAPVGVQNANPAQQRAAAAAGLGIFPATNAQRRGATAAPPGKQPPATTKSLLVTQPVRSGTQLYARGGDLIVLSSVGAGAEIIADGHIHVYGTLRGRAIAGATGDTAARIFVRRLEAELISVAGRYLVSDHIGPEHVGQTAQVMLQDDRLVIVNS